MPRDPSWRIEDRIDLDILLEETAESGESEGPRRMFREFCRQEGMGEGELPDRPRLFRYWLDRERTSSGRMWPGALLARSRKLLALLLWILALLAGGSVATALLHYDGDEPVNVFRFLVVLVGFQIALTLGSTAALSLPVADKGIVRPFLRLALDRTLRFCGKRCRERDRLRLAAFMGNLRRKSSRYGSFLVLCLGRLSQSFGIGFNLGAITATLFAVTFRDLAFGWQTSLALAPESVEGIARILSTPWAWAWPGALPSLEAIQGSRIHLKESLHPLETSHLTAWWPFLVASLCTYGLLPRLILHLGLLTGERWQERRFGFDTIACRRIWTMMTGNSLALPRGEPTAVKGSAGAESEPDPAPTGGMGRSAILLAEPALAKRLDHAGIEDAIRKHFSWKVTRRETLPGEDDSFEDLLRRLESGDSTPGVILLQEGYRPHTAEMLDGIRELAAHLGERGSILLLLVGRPVAKGGFASVGEMHHRIWGHAVKQLGLDNLSLAALPAT